MRRFVFLAGALVGCDSAPTPAPAPVSAGIETVSSAAPGTAVAAAPSTAPAPDARALFDEAMRAELDGDALEARDRWVRLAALAPDTSHGRYALRAAGGGDMTTLLAGVGVLSAIAVPSFLKYQDRARTSEATLELGTLVHAAQAFYTTERFGPDGAAAPARFPQRTELTPDRSACLNGEAVPHSPDPTLWEGPGWTELGFRIEGPFFYQYQFIADGEGTSARFTARALGDLDCDGIFSTFERVGGIDPDGNVTISNLSVIRETE